MKNYYFILLLIFGQHCFAQTDISKGEKIEKLTRIWGLVKYHHPEVSRGSFDINSEFLKQLEKLESSDSRSEFNSQMFTWISSLGSKDLKPEKNERKREKLFIRNAHFGWIENSGFSKELQGLLQKIQWNKNYKDHYASVNRWSSYVEFENDQPLENFDATNEAHRLLFLAHFWNAMKYWNVNIYLTETDWSQVLSEMIPNFNKKEAKSFEGAKEKLFSKLNDSHSNYLYSHTLNSLTHYPDFGGRIINDSLVVTRIFKNDSLKNEKISVGDIIYSVEGVKLKKYYTDKFSEVISVSNKNYLKNEIQNSYLLAADKDSVRVGVLKKNGARLEQFIPLNELKYPYEKYERKHPEKTEKWKLLGEDIGYLNLYEITKEEVNEAFREFEGTNGIIIDLRSYPRNISQATLPNYLYPRRKKFVRALTPELPSYGNPNTKAALSFIMNPFVAGKRNRDYYKGTVILLVDRATLSQAEWIGMGIQAAPNVITVGEQTGGAVLNRNGIMLMDNTSIDFTKATAFYPNGTEVQGKGLKLDVEIEESAINYNKDLYLETAINIIKETNQPGLD